jgi:uncharacterized protein involved in exopolysaccharide biosynthesis
VSQSVPEANTSEDAVDLIRFVAVLARRKWIIILATVLCLAAGLAAAFLSTPVYRSQAVLAAVDQEQDGLSISSMMGQLGGLLPLGGLASQPSSSKEQALAILRGRSFTEEFIADENLMPVLFADLWDAEAGRWRADDAADAPTLHDAFRLFDEEIRRVSEDSATGLVTLSVEWTDRFLAREWADKLVARLNERIRAQAITEAESKIEYLNQELEKTSVVDLQQVIYRLMQTQISAITAANVNEQYAFRVLDRPAVADEDDFVWPQRRLLVIAGLLAGFVTGVVLALLADFYRRYKDARRRT